ncbi:MAG TPA: alpha/beta-type small acid-soluble spore protein [Firmicutes bacterium]|nr:alpha/beta-type small acid-soluble spore protein [Bacillota bacterium]
MPAQNNTGRNRALISGAQQALEKFKNEVASELGIDYSGDKGNLTSRQNGYVGGTMVKRMIAEAESRMASSGQSPQQAPK